MALTFVREGDEPSGEFTRVTEWSCPYHDHDINPIGGYGESDPEWEPGEFCNSCLVAGWRKLYNPDGSPMMREMTRGEVMGVNMMRALVDNQMAQASVLSDMLKASEGELPKIVWLEDGV